MPPAGWEPRVCGLSAAGSQLLLAGPAWALLSPRPPPQLPLRVSALGSGTGRLSLGRAVTSPGHRPRRRLPEVSLRTAGHARRAHAHTRTARPVPPRTLAASLPARSSAHTDATLERPRQCLAPSSHTYGHGNASLSHTLPRILPATLSHSHERGSRSPSTAAPLGAPCHPPATPLLHAAAPHGHTSALRPSPQARISCALSPQRTPGSARTPSYLRAPSSHPGNDLRR